MHNITTKIYPWWYLGISKLLENIRECQQILWNNIRENKYISIKENIQAILVFMLWIYCENIFILQQVTRIHCLLNNNLGLWHIFGFLFCQYNIPINQKIIMANYYIIANVKKKVNLFVILLRNIKIKMVRIVSMLNICGKVIII